MATPSPYPFQVPINSLTATCYETIVQPTCHREVALGYVYEDHIEYWCVVHAPATPHP